MKRVINIFNSILSALLITVFFCTASFASENNSEGIIHKKNKTTIGWDLIDSKEQNMEDSYITKKASELGLDVIAPTWFYIDDAVTDNNLIDAKEKADKSYVDKAHSNGYKVWGVFSYFKDEKEDADEHIKKASYIFGDDKLSMKIIDKVVNYAVDFRLDGINIDFEGFGAENREGFCKFVKELSQILNEKGIVVSVNVTPIAKSKNSSCYDRAELSKYVDYVILLAYDEHYEGINDNVYSKGSVSVADYLWVQDAIDGVLKEVPSEKLILGVPFYTRSFIIGDKNDDNITYKAIGEKGEIAAKDIASLYNKHKGNTWTYFDNYLQQNVLEYDDYDNNKKQSIQHIVYIEDDYSMSWRVNFVNTWGLGGLAAWHLGSENASFWDIIKTNLSH